MAAHGALPWKTGNRGLASCNVVYRAVYLAMFQGGMGIGELVYWSEHGLESVREQLQQRVRYLKIDLPGRKKLKFIRPYHTFLGRDAITALAQYVETRPEVDHDHIFLNQFLEPVTPNAVRVHWHNKLMGLGLITKKGSSCGNRYGMNPHEMRDVFRTRWEMSPASATAAEYFMGHTVDPLEYNKAFRNEAYSMEQYRQAEPYLNILSEDPTMVPKVELDKVRDDQQNQKSQMQAMMDVIEGLSGRILELEEDKTDF